ncbi:hypothetical protein D6853_07105 [Butyrivibrio sp. X503]|uniref:hypothetical protein n=1 Tax=Butyrivibrio sp. X503 TaxID=2364878 RepID=UPI000EA863AC|nr:hypothetical protein [Butyrivibrio sp. X503]RKM56548.1 hypothetical protein D6853_07105 [Butyrivibrio sp. X503]
MKRSILILVGVSFFAFILIIIMNKQTHYVRLSEIKQYVKDNTDYLTDISEQLLDRQVESDVYRLKKELLIQNDNIDKLYSDMNILNIFVCKNLSSRNDEVRITLKEKNGNFICGIYYSPSGKILKYGTPQEGDTYEYNDEYGDRHIYRSEKICDYWYYFEDDTWN